MIPRQTIKTENFSILVINFKNNLQMINENFNVLNFLSLELDNIPPVAERKLSEAGSNKMNDFSSVCEMDPTEILQRKFSESDRLDKIFGSSIALEGTNDIFSSINKDEFSFSTEELIDDLDKMKESQNLSTSQELPKAEKVTSIEEQLPKVKKTRKCRAWKLQEKKAKKSKVLAEKVKSFSDRKRFSKKHDRGKQDF